MRPVMSVAYLAVAIAAMGCSEIAAPNSSLVGEWIATREQLRPAGSSTTNLVFFESGRFSYTTRLFGLYPGQGTGELSAYTVMSGSYHAEHDRLAFTVDRVATWDSFYGPSARERVEQVRFTIMDETRFRIEGAKLILHYITYPADAPEPASRTFTRLGSD